MTDPRIEAAVDAWASFIKIVSMGKTGKEIRDILHDIRKGMTLAIEAADAAAWRPIAGCDVKGPVLVLQGKKQIVAQKVMDAELSDTPVWIPAEGETNESDCGYLVYLHPEPTHWQPLPTPPSPCK